MDNSMGCAIDTAIEVVPTILDCCSEVIVGDILVGFNDDIVALTDGKINPISGIRLDRDEIVRDDGQIVVI